MTDDITLQSYVTSLEHCHAYAMGFDDGYHKGFRTDFPDANPQYRHYYNVGYHKGVTDWNDHESQLEAQKQPEPEPLRKYLVRFHTISEQGMTVTGYDAEDACNTALRLGITGLASNVIDTQWDIEEIKE